MKKINTLAAALSVTLLTGAMGPVSSYASEDTTDIITEATDPDFSSLTPEQWAQYEFNEDYRDVISNVTSFDHDYLRQFLDDHWQLYFQFLIPDARTMSDDEAYAFLTEYHNARETAVADVDVESKKIYLWGDDNVPTITEYTENPDFVYADDPDFEPYMLEVLIDDDTEVKGAVVIASGGGHNYRSNIEEGYESARALNARGYQCFIVNYRIAPFSDEESALDIARAIRIVRANADKYGIDEDKIATAGFSYGGIVASLASENYDGLTDASVLDESYIPDELDTVSADANAYLAIYSVTPDEVNNPNFPPTFFIYGSEDATLWDWGYSSYQMLREKDYHVELHTVSGVPHAFGAGVHADGTLYENAATWPMLADIFMQHEYAIANENAALETEIIPEEESSVEAE